jgi:type 2 lantibiotic biosynthesis protein LanM
VLHVTRTIDANYENLVAAGEFPVLIDTETILHPDLPPLSFGDAPDTVANDTFYHEKWLRSCARVRMLPHKVGRTSGLPALDLSAIGCIRPQPAGQSQQWINCNQDGMNLESIATCVRPTHNVARLAGQPLEPSQYVSEICEGFRRGCEILLAVRSQLLAPDGLWELFRDCTARVLFRNTDIYARTLENSTNPQNLRNGFDYSLCFEPLSLPFLLESGNDSRWSIFQTEQRQLERGQVPYFVRSADSRELGGPTGEVLCREFFPQSALHDSRQYLAKLSEDEIAFQQFVIRGVFTAELRATKPSESRSRDRQGAEPVVEDTPLPDGRGSESSIAAAVMIADAIGACSLSSSSGAVNWMSVQDLPGGESAAFGPLPDRLYDGRLGIAVFLAAVDSAQGTDRYRELLNRATSELRATLSRRWASQAALLSGGLGATHGWGGILYGLTRLATLCGDETFLDSAMCAATAIDRNLIRHDRQFDLFSGSAGLAVGLLALHDVANEPQLLTLANACGEHLLTHQRVQEHGASWEFPVKPFASGLAHGNAGVALALARLFQATRSESFLNAAKHALLFEDIKLAGASLDGTLCGGMTGLLLARWGCSVCAPDELSEFFVSALPNLEPLNPAQMPVAQLCCGRAGVEELRIVLASTSRQLPEDHRENENEAVAFSAMDDPSLFRGLAGSGYVRLRSAAPDLVPCVPLFL